jgi:hypothetical protein
MGGSEAKDRFRIDDGIPTAVLGIVVEFSHFVLAADRRRIGPNLMDERVTRQRMDEVSTEWNIFVL